MNRSLLAALVLIVATAASASAQSAEDIAKALQDPLANVKMIALDNAFNFKTGDADSVSGYNFQLQPVYAFSFEKFNFIPRAVIPIVGIPGDASFPNLPGQRPPSEDVTWGLSDIIIQTFFNLKSEAAWKFGFGPQVSLKTRTDDLLAGAGWGGGLGVVAVGGFGNVSTVFMVSQHWSFDGDFSLATLQPMIYLNLPGAMTIHYNNSMTYNAKGSDGNQWTVPLGAGVSKTFLVGGGNALDFAVGFYSMVERPKGGPKSQGKFAITWVMP